MLSNETLPPYPGDDAVLQQLQQAPEHLCCRVWEEPTSCIVLGRGGKLEREVTEETVLQDNVVVYRRSGGGGTVVLSPGMLVVAIAAHVKDPYGSKRYFQLLQEPIIETLEELGLPGVTQRGLSDLAYQGRKILGSSMRRQRTLMLYQGVLLVDVDRDMFDRYLPHPPKEPDYREGRSHQSFTVTLRELGLEASLDVLQTRLQAHLHERLIETLADDLTEPHPSLQKQS